MTNSGAKSPTPAKEKKTQHLFRFVEAGGVVRIVEASNLEEALAKRADEIRAWDN